MKKAISLDELLQTKDLTKELSELSFENGLKLMEELVSKVESGGLALDKAVLSYERGVELLAHLRTLLSGAEEKLKLLSKGRQEPGE